jgi:FMN phosphatase YigB (HAD superfamily)
VTERAFFAALEDTIKQGVHHRQVFESFVPGFDLGAARRERAARGDPDMFDRRDLYPDVVPCLRALQQHRYRIGVAGNQRSEAGAALEALDLKFDIVASSASLGVDKPAPAFFERLAGLADAEPGQIAHVGDRLDNDILPARALGFVTVFLERGPWARLYRRMAGAGLADIRLRTLADLPSALATAALPR